MKQKFKKLYLLLTGVIFLSVLLSGCSSLEFNIEETIKPPDNGNVAIQGTWRIDKYISILKGQGALDEDEESNKNKYIGKEAVFDNEIGVIGIDVCTNPDYKIIRTSADSFLKSTYQTNCKSLGIKKEKVNVVTISTANKFFNQLIVTDDMTAYVYLENGFLVMKKISDLADEKIKKSSVGKAEANNSNEEFEEDPLLRSGVLMGIRSADNTCCTIWIYSKNREIKAVSYREQLMVPRAYGFWEAGVIQNMNQSIYAEAFVNSHLQAIPRSGSKDNILSDKPGAKILFVGNDYIGVEYNSKLSVMPMDNIGGGNSVSISDVILDSSFNVSNEFTQSRQAYISSLDSGKLKNIIGEPDEKNYTLKRRNGHWILKSRLYFKEDYDGKKYEDFDLNLVVPSTLIHYDEMDIPWNNIKSKLPWTTDAYMSPNKDIAILVSRDSLNIYPVQKRNIINKQLMKIPLSEGDSVVMAEWSVGKYADIWARFVDGIFTDIQDN
ncbi:hypothetical protein LY28_03062 [Ruminiclostridium sufflavum DSM 19573]|uniref:Lipoprotein n=1 Tax=Ruminiclostridium sufflavum DSM 19573 TaxID=1121337 RepID=A0A318XJJ4_9FIRM|nr:hypothetical protein [Ruminiclostridium sufflavum]PYG85908.1 hypothetical protein LY28_03062 [Ruminiclostridium sufflavum DSM 19573]